MWCFGGFHSWLPGAFDSRDQHEARTPAWPIRSTNGTLSATDPDLNAFFAHGGKLLQYHGWSDNQLSPLNSVNYYRSVLKAMGGASHVKDSYRLFMIPRMPHCREDDRIPRGGMG